MSVEDAKKEKSSKHQKQQVPHVCDMPQCDPKVDLVNQ